MELDRNALKVQALLERVRDLTVDFESRDADRRVEITILNAELDERNSEREDLINQVATLRERLEAVTEGIVEHEALAEEDEDPEQKRSSD